MAEKTYQYVKNLWNDAESGRLSPADQLVYRSNKLGCDQRVTNAGGGKLSSKTMEKDPLTGERIEVLGPPPRQKHFETLDSAWHIAKKIWAIREIDRSFRDWVEFEQNLGLIWSSMRTSFRRKTGCACLGKCYCPNDVDSLVMEALRKLQPYFDSARNVKSPSGLIYKICNGGFVSQLRRSRHDPLSVKNIASLNDQSGDSETEDEKYGARTEANFFAKEWLLQNCVTETEKEFFFDLFLNSDKLTLTEIAHKYRLSRPTVSRRKADFEERLHVDYWHPTFNSKNTQPPPRQAIPRPRGRNHNYGNKTTHS